MSMSFPMKVEVGYFCPNCCQWFKGKPLQAWLFNADDYEIPDGLHIEKDWNYVIRTDTETMLGEPAIICHDNPACVSSDYSIEDYTPAVAGSLQCTECAFNVMYDDADLTKSVLVEAGMEEHFDAAWNISVSTTPRSDQASAQRVVENHFKEKHSAQYMLLHALSDKKQVELAAKLKVNQV